ncbi:MAG: hypothetical protein DWI03_01875 [Planctomycetota bacterium]|nr:MAG: hypothetical protein DWI03_01875 [Planctomycetota bacterium]
MNPVLARIPAAALGACLGASLLLAGAARAAAADARVIYMVIQTEPTTTLSEVKQKFESARKGTTGCTFKDMVVEPVDAETYLVLRSVLTRGTGAKRDGSAATKAALIEPLQGEDGSWSINLGSAYGYMDSATVVADAGDGKGEKTLEVGVGVANPDGFDLRFHSPGTYVLKLPKGRPPRSIRFEVTEDDGVKTNKREVSQAWPNVGRCYLVTLNDIVGNEALLFESLRDPKKVGNPIKELQPASLMVASFIEVLGKRVSIVDGKLVFDFPKPRNVEPKRLWVLFPLNGEQLARERESIEAILAQEDGFKKLPDVIRKGIRKGALRPDSPAGWVELPLVGDRFTARSELDVEGWKKQLGAQANAVGDNALLVYEFEGTDGEKLPLKMTEGYMVPDRIGEWVSELRAME